MDSSPRLVVVSNRLPITIKQQDSSWAIQPSSGGLVTALEAVLRVSRGMWVGWDGAKADDRSGIDAALTSFSEQSTFELRAVPMSAKAVDGFYRGFANQIIWPLFHDLQSQCNFDPSYWAAYQSVTASFADVVTGLVRSDDLVWVQDFHLMGLGQELRRKGVPNRLCFFLHIPFPPPDIFLKLPWRNEVLQSLLAYDVVGLQSARDLKNFIDGAQAVLGARAELQSGRARFSVDKRSVTVGSFPISIDFTEFDQQAQQLEVRSRSVDIRKDMNVESLILSVDRLDYTKGIPYRIRAFRRLLERSPELRKRVVMMQIVVPSRVDVDQYQQLRSEIDQLVTQVNGELGEPGWVPVQHFFRSVTREELLASYLAADVALVTPLKDGMNLVCKEYCAAHFDERGVLVLSEFAGAAEELAGLAMMVNPYDIDGVADAIHRAVGMDIAAQQSMMRQLRATIRARDVFAWARAFLSEAGWTRIGPDGSVTSSATWQKLWRILSIFDV